MADEGRKAVRVQDPPVDPKSVGDVDAMKASLLAVEERLQDLSKTAGASMTRSDFDAAWAKLADEQKSLSKAFADALVKFGAISPVAGDIAKRSADEGEKVSDFLLGFW